VQLSNLVQRHVPELLSPASLKCGTGKGHPEGPEQWSIMAAHTHESVHAALQRINNPDQRLSLKPFAFVEIDPNTVALDFVFEKLLYVSPENFDGLDIHH
jgi:hypothetical protein